VGGHDEDGGGAGQRPRPGLQLDDPQRIVDQRRRAVTQIQGGHPAGRCRGGGQSRNVLGGTVRHRLMIRGLTAEFLVHFVLPVPAFPLSLGR
jgi:hypothetical protein